MSAAAHGGEALEEVACSDFDAIVLDIQMPVMDGIEFHRTIRERGVTTPVLVLSAHDARAAQRWLNAEAALNKPFDPDDLTRELEALTSRDGDRP